jgi:hypothetical protein
MMKPEHRSILRSTFPAFLITSLFTSRARAHEEGAPFSDAIVDPLVLHHAHIENEERLNLFMLDRVRDVETPGRQGYASELELAYGLPNHRYGFEIFVPLSDMPAPQGTGRVMGLSDVRVRPIKLALYMQPEFILSTASEVSLPTGRRTRGLGAGSVGLEQMLFADMAQGNWNIGMNLGLGYETGQEKSIPVEYGAVLGYSFIGGTEYSRIARVEHAQAWVPTVSLEFLGEHYFARAIDEHNSLAVIPGVALWHVPTGWQFRFGFEAAALGQIEANSIVLLQVGNHLKWL